VYFSPQRSFFPYVEHFLLIVIFSSPFPRSCPFSDFLAPFDCRWDLFYLDSPFFALLGNQARCALPFRQSPLPSDCPSPKIISKLLPPFFYSLVPNLILVIGLTLCKYLIPPHSSTLFLSSPAFLHCPLF